MVNPHLIYEMSTSVDLNSMSLMALKKMAKGRRIKQYYVLPKAKLVELLGHARASEEVQDREDDYHGTA